MIRIYTTVLVMFLSVSGLFAQQDSAKRTTTTVIFGSGTAGEESSGKYNANAIKINVFGMFSGMAGLTYERELSSIFSVEVGGGLTFRNLTGNIWQQMLDEIGDDGTESSPNFNEYLDEPDQNYEFDRRKAVIGTYFTIMPRYYYQEDGFDGSYLGISLQRRTYKYEAFGIDPLSSGYGSIAFVDGSGNRDEIEKQTNIGITWGYSNVSDKTVLDFYTSIGIRSINAQRIDVGYVEPTPFDTPVPVIGSKMRDVKKTSFYYELGFRFGFWWD